MTLGHVKWICTGRDECGAGGGRLVFHVIQKMSKVQMWESAQKSGTENRKKSVSYLEVAFFSVHLREKNHISYFDKEKLI